MFVCKIFVEFMIYSLIGWVYECTYCTVKEGHWSNRGFLFGPVCPIYGTGSVLTTIIFGYLPFFRGTPYEQIPMWKKNSMLYGGITQTCRSILMEEYVYLRP